MTQPQNTNPLEEPLTEPEPDEGIPGENPEVVRPYLEASAVRRVVEQGGEKFCLSQWRKHNAQAGWLKTIEYPPQAADSLGRDIYNEAAAPGFVERVVEFLLKGKKFWSIQNAARQVVQLAGVRVFDRLINPPTKQVPVAVAPSKAPAKVAQRQAAGVK